MTSITASPVLSPRRGTAARPERPAPVAVPAEDDHQPHNDVPGPDESTLARTTGAVVTSLVLLVGLAVAVAYGAGTAAVALLEWFGR